MQPPSLPFLARRSILQTAIRGVFSSSKARRNETSPYGIVIRTPSAIQPQYSARSNAFLSQARRQQEQGQLRHESIATNGTDVLEQFGLSEIPKQEHPGAEVDKSGTLQITCRESSRRRHKTALVLSRAAFSLVEEDFARAGKCINTFKNGMGLQQIIPVRDSTSFLRQCSWILLFSSPLSAARYQSNVHRLQSVVRDSLPSSFTSKIAPPPNYTTADGTTLNDYTLSAPWQKASIRAYLAPFDEAVQRPIDLHNSLTSTRELGFPVHVWIDQDRALLITAELLRRLLSSDGAARGATWKLIVGDRSITPLTGDFNHGMLGQHESSERSQGKHWCLIFRTSSEAKRFVRAWHRRPWPRGLIDLSSGPSPLLKAECLFQDDVL